MTTCSDRMLELKVTQIIPLLAQNVAKAVWIKSNVFFSNLPTKSFNIYATFVRECVAKNF